MSRDVLKTRLLTEAELRQVVSIDQAALDSVESAFAWLEQGRVRMPPIMHIAAADRGDVDVKSAYVDGLPVFAIKIASGFYGNADRGLPSGSAMMVLLSADTGFCEAVLLDNSYLTDLRTGLAGAVAARYLAPSAIETVGVIGTGTQARYQVRCLKLVREFGKVVVWGRNESKAGKYADDLREEGLVVAVAESAQACAAASDLLITTTPSDGPIVRSNWLREGQHVTAVGADFPGKQELDASVFAEADRIACDRLSQCLVNGELQHVAVDGALPSRFSVVELGQLVTGAAQGRQRDDELTICDLTGTGVQDTAIANLAYDLAVKRGLGTIV